MTCTFILALPPDRARLWALRESRRLVEFDLGLVGASSFGSRLQGSGIGAARLTLFSRLVVAPRIVSRGGCARESADFDPAPCDSGLPEPVASAGDIRAVSDLSVKD